MELIIVTILTWVFSILSMCLGLYVGSQFADKPINLKLPKIIKRKHVIGAIPKLTPTDIELKGTRREGTIKAMEETLDDLL